MPAGGLLVGQHDVHVLGRRQRSVLHRAGGLQPSYAASYVLENVPQADRDRFLDPAAEEASVKISAYGAQVCVPRSDK